MVGNCWSRVEKVQPTSSLHYLSLKMRGHPGGFLETYVLDWKQCTTLSCCFLLTIHLSWQCVVTINNIVAVRLGNGIAWAAFLCFFPLLYFLLAVTLLLAQGTHVLNKSWKLVLPWPRPLKHDALQIPCYTAGFSGATSYYCLPFTFFPDKMLKLWCPCYD